MLHTGLAWYEEPLGTPEELAQYILHADNDSELYCRARFFINRSLKSGGPPQHLTHILALDEVKQAVRCSGFPSDYAFAKAIYDVCRQIIASIE